VIVDRHLKRPPAPLKDSVERALEVRSKAKIQWKFDTQSRATLHLPDFQLPSVSGSGSCVQRTKLLEKTPANRFPWYGDGCNRHVIHRSNC